MSRLNVIARTTLIGLILVTGSSFSSALAAEAAPVFSTASSMADNLTALKGKRVTVYLRSGEKLSGVVGPVGNHLLHLEQLSGREYFDALIAIDQIVALETRARG